MKNICNEPKSIIYADDTNLIITGNTMEETVVKANRVLNKFSNYFNMNKLSLNESKTKYMVFTQKKLYSNTSNLILNEVELERVKSIKFLGVILNDGLDWRDHKIYVKSKISKNIGVLNRCRKILNLNDIVSMYNCFILPYLSYCLPLWGSCNISENDIIKKAQNRFVRIMTKTKRTHRAWEKLSQLKILPIESLYKLEISKMCHKHVYGNLPSTFEDNIMPKLSIMIHSASTRHSNDLNYHFNTSSQLNFSNKSFTADCVRIWNDIPYKIKKQSSNKIFTSDLTTNYL